jgi:hypothetical protein
MTGDERNRLNLAPPNPLALQSFANYLPVSPYDTSVTLVALDASAIVTLLTSSNSPHDWYPAESEYPGSRKPQ